MMNGGPIEARRATPTVAISTLVPRCVPKVGRENSSCLPIIVAERSAESLSTFDDARVAMLGWQPVDQLVMDSLVISFPVVVLDVLGHDPP